MARQRTTRQMKGTSKSATHLFILILPLLFFVGKLVLCVFCLVFFIIRRTIRRQFLLFTFELEMSFGWFSLC